MAKTTARQSATAKTAAKAKKTSTAKTSAAKVAAKKKVTSRSGAAASPAKGTAATKKSAAKPAAKKATTSSPAAKKMPSKKKAPSSKAPSSKKTLAKKTASKASPAKGAAATKKAAGGKKAASKRSPIGARSLRDVSAEEASERIVEIPDSNSTVIPYERDRSSHYMDAEQLTHFRRKLIDWKQQLMEEVDRTVGHMKDDATNFPDPNDRATQEEEFSLELRTRDRERKLIKKINEAQKRIDDDEYGYCETCGIEIGVSRLEARPTAELCIDCKTLEEIRERQTA